MGFGSLGSLLVIVAHVVQGCFSSWTWQCNTAWVDYAGGHKCYSEVLRAQGSCGDRDQTQGLART